ncbi:MAG: regulatory protein RecX [Methylococcales bacterium]|jgi:regulatory protein|nr:regulatory protein RecX [Methylococcales bacterium]MBT7444786.1 regulatory protein RecX [Methylococcales bacterium]
MLQKKPKCSAYDSAVYSLARREHGTEELRLKLHSKGFVDVEIDEALVRLQSHDYLNDDRYCEAYIRMRQRKGYGPIKIRCELQTRGIASGRIEQHLNASDVVWVNQAQLAWEKKFGARAVDSKEKAKQYRFLQYRGFTSEHIHLILN